MKIKITSFGYTFFWLIFSTLIIAQTPNPDMAITSGYINTIAIDGNYTYIGGAFSHVGPPNGSGAKLTTTSDIPDVTFPKVNGSISAVAPDGNDGWYIGGNFTKVGNYSITNLAHINNNGSVDNTWLPEPNGGVLSIVVNDDAVFVGGQFTNIAGTGASYTAKFNKTTGILDAAWTATVLPNRNVLVLALNDEFLYIGGSFVNYTGQEVGPLVRVNAATGVWDQTWTPAYNASSINAIAFSATDVYVGGRFTVGIGGGVSTAHLVKIDRITGIIDHTFAPSLNNDVYSLAIDGDHIFIGGSFESINGQTRHRLAKLNKTNGLVDANFSPGFNGIVRSIAISGSDIYVAGDFTNIGTWGNFRWHLAKLNSSTGAVDGSWHPVADANMNSITIAGTNIYAGGYANSIGGSSIWFLARINNINGRVDPDWNPNPSNEVKSIAIDGNHNIYVGGSFTSIGGASRNYLAKLNNTNGDADATWNPSPNSAVSSIAISGSEIFVGGHFTSIGGESRGRIAKLNNTNGNADATWNPNANSAVYTIAISGANIYLGGEFTFVGGSPRNYLAKVDKSTGNNLDVPYSGCNDRVNSLAVSNDALFVGGNFSLICGESRLRLAKLNLTDLVPTAWAPSPNGSISTIAIDGLDIYVGGNFQTIGGASRNYLAKLNNTNGDADATWNPNANGPVHTITISGSDIYTGGSFNRMGGSSQPWLALFTSRVLPVELTSFTALSTSGSIELKWQTATEKMNYGFDVEVRAKAEAAAWQKIGFVPGNGNSNAPKSYNYTHKDVAAGLYQYRLKQIDTDGSYEYSDVIEVLLGAPKNYALSQNYPNPFNPETTISFELPEKSEVTISIFSSLGELVKTVVTGQYEAGRHSVQFNAIDLSSGVYFYRIAAGKYVKTMKMMLMK